MDRQKWPLKFIWLLGGRAVAFDYSVVAGNIQSNLGGKLTTQFEFNKFP